MSGCRLVPLSLRVEVREQLRGVHRAHPLVGVGPVHAVLRVLERHLSGLRRDVHSRQRTPVFRDARLRAVAVLALVTALVLAPGLLSLPPRPTPARPGSRWPSPARSTTSTRSWASRRAP